MPETWGDKRTEEETGQGEQDDLRDEEERGVSHSKYTPPATIEDDDRHGMAGQGDAEHDGGEGMTHTTSTPGFRQPHVERDECAGQEAGGGRQGHEQK